MSKKHLILSFLLFAYTIVLGHNIIPHGHFDDLFASKHQHENDHHQDSQHNSDNHHNYPFSHSVTLHVALDKQTVFTSHPIKNLSKKAPLSHIYCNAVKIQPFLFSSYQAFIFYEYAHPPTHICSSSFSNRPPPIILA